MDEEYTNSLDKIVNLHICHDQVLLWDPSEIIYLRQKHRIIGCPVGCYPAKPRQNSHLSLPIQLNKIEARFVLDHAKCTLVKSGSRVQDDKDLQALVSERAKQHLHQLQLKERDKVDLIESMADCIKQGKQSKKVRLAEQGASQNINERDPNNFETFKTDEIKKVYQVGMDQTWIKMEQYHRYQNTEVTPGVLCLSNSEIMQYYVYKDLHFKGYFLTDGMKFGGHFLVYPGDPGVYHSTFIALCIDSNQDLSTADYSTLGRLASSVKKTMLICSVSKSVVSYTSLAWSGVV